TADVDARLLVDAVRALQPDVVHPRAVARATIDDRARAVHDLEGAVVPRDHVVDEDDVVVVGATDRAPCVADGIDAARSTRICDSNAEHSNASRPRDDVRSCRSTPWSPRPSWSLRTSRDPPRLARHSARRAATCCSSAWRRAPGLFD